MSWPLHLPEPPARAELSAHQRLMWRQQMLQQQSAVLRGELESQGTLLVAETQQRYAGLFRWAGLALRWGVKAQAWWRESEQANRRPMWWGAAGAGWLLARLLKRRPPRAARADEAAWLAARQRPSVALRVLQGVRWARRGLLLWRIWRSMQPRSQPASSSPVQTRS